MTREVVVDFETYYDKEYSLSKMPTWNYVFDDRFDAYLMSVVAEDFQWVGPPETFSDWDVIRGCTGVAHNASFDGVVWHRLFKDGVFPFDLDWFCTADMAVYLGFPRALDKLILAAYGKQVDKRVRTRMLGKNLRLMFKENTDKEFLDEVRAYGLADSVYTHQFWKDYSGQWPDAERRVSQLNREAGWRGFRVDRKMAEDAARHLKQLKFDAEQHIPWDWDPDKTPLARAKIIEQCRETDDMPGFWYPASFAQDDPECQQWEEEFGEKMLWIGAIRDWRRTHMLLTKVETLVSGLREDDTFSYSNLYFGANTGRFSGAGAKFNTQNLPRASLFGVDLRGMIIPREGHEFLVADFAQIEARYLLWLVKDQEALDAIAEYGNIYDAYARRIGLYTGTEPLKDADPTKYQYSKASVLSLGFGAGPNKFRLMAKTPAYGNLDLDVAEAELAVELFRRNNPRIVKLWYGLDRQMKRAAAAKEDFIMKLPSGRRLGYYAPRLNGGQVSVQRFRGIDNVRRKVYGGLLTENCVQAGARDIMVDGWRALEDAGYKVLMTVHDEYVIEVPKGQCDTDEVNRIVSNASPWAGGMPIELEFKLVSKYTK